MACCAVTSIGRDHEEILGHDLKDIAYEKSCIIKEGVGGCVIGPTASEFSIFQEQFNKSGCPPEKFRQIIHEESKNHISFREDNKMIAKEIVKMILNKSSLEDLSDVVPDSLFD